MLLFILSMAMLVMKVKAQAGETDGVVHGSSASFTMDQFGNPNSAFHFDGSSFIQIPSGPALTSIASSKMIGLSVWLLSSNGQ